MEREKTELRPFAENNFTRHGFDREAVPETLVPSWVWGIGIYAGITEEERRKVESGESESLGLVGQLSDKFRVISQSLRFSREEDVVAFETMLTSIRHFWPEVRAFRGSNWVAKDLNGKQHVMKSDAAIFSEEAEKWLIGNENVKPISAEAVAAWFDGVGGLACTDPTVVKKFFSSEGVYDIPPLAGIAGIKNYPGDNSDIDQTWALENIRSFASGCSDILLKRIEALKESGSDNGDLTDKLEKVAESAGNLSLFLGSAREGSYKEMDISRPTPAANIIKPVSVALYEKLQSVTPENYDSNAERKIARGLVRIFRTKRVSVGREGIMSFCSAFLNEDSVIKGNLPFEGAYAGLGLEEMEKIKNPSGEIIDIIKSGVITEFVYQMRYLGYNTFEWTEDDYRNLGFQELWKTHEERLINEQTKPVSGITDVDKGDAVVEFSGELDTIHEGHIQLLWEVAEDLEKSELRRAGFLDNSFRGKWRVGVNVNTGNMVKAGKSKVPQERWIVTRDSLKNIEDIFLHSILKASLGTADRMDYFRNFYHYMGSDLYSQIRLTGLDKLDPELGIYTEQLEPKGFESLNRMPHIFGLQLAHLDNPYSFGKVIKSVFEKTKEGSGKFGDKVMVLLVHLPEVHSSFIKEKMATGGISDEVLATLIHPRNIKKVRELYDPSYMNIAVEV